MKLTNLCTKITYVIRFFRYSHRIFNVKCDCLISFISSDCVTLEANIILSSTPSLTWQRRPARAILFTSLGTSRERYARASNLVRNVRVTRIG